MFCYYDDRSAKTLSNAFSSFENGTMGIPPKFPSKSSVTTIFAFVGTLVNYSTSSFTQKTPFFFLFLLNSICQKRLCFAISHLEML